MRYHVSFPAPGTHHVEVEFALPARAAGETTLWMPAWTPGSYMIREFARNVRSLRARDADGRPVPVVRVAKDRFAVGEGRGEISVRYAVYAFEWSVRTTYVDDEGALLNGASTFLAVEGREGEPHEVVFDLPAGWRVDAALRRDAGGAFLAQDFEHLVDAPFLCGGFEVLPFAVEGVPHRLTILGEGGDAALRERLARDTAAIVAENARAFGGLPYDEYAFALLLSAEGRGGLEHRNSSVLLHPRHGLSDPKGYHDLLTLIAHEHYHVWNVKRSRPREFCPYDLGRECYTRSLWVCEGVTSYYDELVPLRAGVVSRAAWLERQGEAITRYLETPGRAHETLEDASLLAWTRLYRPDEDTPNSGVSYYAKGALAALLVDLEIRTRTASRASLDDVMARLLERFGPDGPGFTGADFEALVSEVAGADLVPFVARLARSTEDLDFDAPLSRFGLLLERVPRAPHPSVRDLLGARVRADSGQLRIDTVERGSPAERCGLSARDEIVALNGFRVRGDELGKRLRELGPGARVALTVFRDDRLRSFDAVLAAELPGVLRLREDRQAGADAVARREAWLTGRGRD